MTKRKFKPRTELQELATNVNHYKLRIKGAQALLKGLEQDFPQLDSQTFMQIGVRLNMLHSSLTYEYKRRKKLLRSKM